MPNPTSIARGIAAATTCLLAAGLATAAPAGAAAHHRPTTFLHTTRHHLVVAPATIRPGVARFHNSGKDPVVILGKKTAAGAAELARLHANAKTPGRLLKEFVVRDEVEPHQTVYLPLHRGTLYLVDARRQHVSAATIRTMRITGRASNAVLPVTRSVTIAPDDSLHATQVATPHGVLHVMNHSNALQALTLVRISSKAAKEKVAAFAAHPTLDKLFDLGITSFAPVAIVAAHHGLWTTVAATRGQYGLLAISFTGRHSPRVRLLTVT